MYSITFRLLPLVFMLLLPACTNMLFYPMKPHVLLPGDVGLFYDDVYVKVDTDVTLHGWRLYSNGDKKGTILYLHGNAENVSTHLANVYWLPDQGYEVYLFDYRGYGASGGEPELEAIVADNEKLISWVARQTGEGERFVLMGHSIGGSLAIHAAAKSDERGKLAALVSISAFSDYRQITQEALATTWLTWLFQWPLSFTIDNSYSPLDYIADVSPVPVVIMHSRSDAIIPYHHATALYEAAAEPKRLIELEGDHNHVFNYENNRTLLLDYLESMNGKGRKTSSADER